MKRDTGKICNEGVIRYEVGGEVREVILKRKDHGVGGTRCKNARLTIR